MLCQHCAVEMMSDAFSYICPKCGSNYTKSAFDRAYDRITALESENAALTEQLSHIPTDAELLDENQSLREELDQYKRALELAVEDAVSDSYGYYGDTRTATDFANDCTNRIKEYLDRAKEPK